MAGTYRIGPSDTFNSADLLADADTLNRQINLLDDQDWTAPAQTLFDAWNGFVSEWRAFYTNTFGGFFNFSAWNDSNRDQLVQFESRFGEFASEYQQATGNALPGGVIAPSTGAQDTLGAHLRNQLQPLMPSVNMSTVLWVVGGLAVGVGGYYGWKIYRHHRGG